MQLIKTEEDDESMSNSSLQTDESLLKSTGIIREELEAREACLDDLRRPCAQLSTRKAKLSMSLSKAEEKLEKFDANLSTKQHRILKLNEDFNMSLGRIKKQLEEFRSRLPTDVVDEIEKALGALEEWRDKDFEADDIDKVKESIEKAKQSMMKIGSSLNS